MLEAVGLPEEEVATWRAAVPAPTGAFEPDTAAAVEYLSLGGALLRRLPERPRRSEREQAAAEAVAAELSVERDRFLALELTPGALRGARGLLDPAGASAHDAGDPALVPAAVNDTGPAPARAA